MGLTRKQVDAAVLGGALLGGGGGGSLEDGRQIGYLAVEVGDPILKEIDDLPEDALVVTVAAVGAPSAPDRYVKPFHYLRALRLLEKHLPQPISGIIANENGAVGTVNGWFQAAVFGIPVVDAPCNGRAHPTMLMGAMGLHRRAGYLARAAACGGRQHTDQYVELHVEGTVDRVAAIVRHASTEAGGIIAVARNPVLASYAKRNGAPRAIRQAIDLGKAMLDAQAQGPESVIEAAADVLGGEMICRGQIADVALSREGGFDRGRAILREGKEEYELTFWNEYMTLESSGQRLATFPGLIATMSMETGLPVSSAELRRAQSVAVVRVPQDRLVLGAGMRDPDLFSVIEEVLAKEIVNYVFREGE